MKTLKRFLISLLCALAIFFIFNSVDCTNETKVDTHPTVTASSLDTKPTAKAQTSTEMTDKKKNTKVIQNETEASEVVVVETTEKQKNQQEDKTKKKDTDKKSNKDKKDTKNKSNLISLGTFRLTAYCNCSSCCGQWAGGATASGVMPTANHTIAVDTSVIPFGTKVVINGNTYTAEDTGSAIIGNRIDVYFDSHSAAMSFGVQYAEVFKVAS